VQINNAITAVNAAGGGTVELTDGTFVCAASIVLKSHVHLDCTRATFTWDVADSLFEATGTEGTSTLLTASGAVGDSSVAVTAAAGFAVGDYVLIGDEGSVYGGWVDGEIHRIRAIAGLTFSLDADLWLAHTTANSAFCMRLDMVHDFSITGGFIDGSSAIQAKSVNGMTFIYCADFKIQDIVSEEVADGFICMFSCVSGEITKNNIWGTARDGAGYVWLVWRLQWPPYPSQRVLHVRTLCQATVQQLTTAPLCIRPLITTSS